MFARPSSPRSPAARPRSVAVGLVTLIATFSVVLVVAALVLPRTITTRSTYCVRCALHVEETERASPLFFRGLPQPIERLLVSHARLERGGVLHRLLAPEVGAHAHVFVDPAAYVPPTSPRKLPPEGEFRQAIVVAEVTDLEQLEGSPHLLALLDEAMRDDPARTLVFAQRILDPRAHVGAATIGLFDRDVPWPVRWQVVDAFFEVYRCNESDTSASCHMTAETTDLLVFARTATSLHEGGIDYRRWVPAGMAVPPKNGKSGKNGKIAAVVTN